MSPYEIFEIGFNAVAQTGCENLDAYGRLQVRWDVIVWKLLDFGETSSFNSWSPKQTAIELVVKYDALAALSAVLEYHDYDLADDDWRCPSYLSTINPQYVAPAIWESLMNATPAAADFSRAEDVFSSNVQQWPAIKQRLEAKEVCESLWCRIVPDRPYWG